MTSSRPWTVSIGKQRPQTWFWKSIFTSAPLWWNVSVHKKNKISTHAVYRFNFMLPFCQKKPPKTRFCETKNVITLCTIIKCSGSYKCFSFDSAGWLFLSWCASDSTQASCRAGAFVCRSEWPAGGNKQGHTHTIVTIHARTDQGIEIYSLLEGCSCGPNRSTAGLLVHFLGPFNSVPSGTVLQRF